MPARLKYAVLAAVALILLAVPAQATTVTATVVDPNGNPYANGTVAVVLAYPTNVIPLVGSTPVNPSTGPFPLDSSGHFSITVIDNATINPPTGTKWSFTTCANTVNINPSVPITNICFTSPPITVTGSSVDLSTQLDAIASILGPGAGQGASHISTDAVLPSTCVSGPAPTPTDIAVVAGVLYVCSSANTWTSAGPGGSIPGNGGPNGGGTSGIVQSGLMAEYRFLDGSGTILHDSSINANNGTLGTGTHAPTWISGGSGGLNFNRTTANQFVALPSALNPALTIQVFPSYFPLNNDYAQNLVDGTSTPGNYYDLLSSGNNISTQILRVNSATNAGAKLATRSSWSGTGLLTWTLDTTDNAYMGTLNVTADLGPSSGSSAGNMTAGNYNIGGLVSSIGLNGNIYYAIFYNRVLTAAEVAQNVTFVNNTMASRGVQAVFDYGGTINPVVSDGDSLTAEYGQLLAITLNGTWAKTEVAATGATLFQNLTPFGSTAVDTIYTPLASQNVDVIWAGTNDIAAGQTVPNTVGQLTSYITSRKAKGWKVVVSTMIDRASLDTQKNAFNTSIRSNWRAWGADALIDPGASMLLGCDGCSGGGGGNTYFLDGTHPRFGAMYNIDGPIYQRGINQIFAPQNFSSATTYTTGTPSPAAVSNAAESGNVITFTVPANSVPAGVCFTTTGITPAGYNTASSNYPCWFALSNPTTTTVTAYNDTTGLGALSVPGTATFPEQKDADVYVNLGGSAMSQNFTLESCVGYTGQNLHIQGLNANAWTVTPFGAETINGSGSIPVAENTTVNLQAILVSSAAGGCNWVTF